MFKQRILIIVVTAASFLSLTLGAAAGEQPTMGKVIGGQVTEFPHWFKESFLEIAEDVKEAKEQNKHVLLFFHLDNCPYCYKMIEENFKAAPYAKFLKNNFDVIVINIRGDREVALNQESSFKEKELAQHLGVRYTPTILFFDNKNKVVLRLNGYRSQQAFKYALDYVNDRAYISTSLSRYIEDKSSEQVYTLRDNNSFSDIVDLSSVSDKPLAVIFEDSSCDGCDTFHDEILKLPETVKLLKKYTVVRLDAFSKQPIKDVSGNSTTPRALASALDITYRPGVVLYDKGKEIMRIDGMLRSFHFQQVLRYVAKRHYTQYPKFGDYRKVNSRAILKSGRDIDLWK